MVISTTSFDLFQILKQKLGEKEAEVLVTFIDAKLKENNESNLNIIATKADLKEEIADVKLKIAETKTVIIRWVFAFFVTLMLA
ncbi:MAG: hypothetical protein JWQ09_2465, partial [Segetibacter sp.]|nr:hypothetical protein [Segetibacter sp.]